MFKKRRCIVQAPEEATVSSEVAVVSPVSGDEAPMPDTHANQEGIPLGVNDDLCLGATGQVMAIDKDVSKANRTAKSASRLQLGHLKLCCNGKVRAIMQL